LSVGLAQKPELQYIDKDTLKGMLGDPNVLLIDVRAPQDWSDSLKKIKGAVRQEPGKVAEWGKTLPPDKNIVLY
jgi:rhodanese-related sulfurtransferase